MRIIDAVNDGAKIVHAVSVMLHGGLTRRFHTVPCLVEHTVGAHSYDVACILWAICPEGPSVELLMAALMHDVPEQQFGDIPSPAKRAMGAESKKALQTAEDNFLGDAALYFPLSIEEERLLKAADILGGLWNCILERRLGNTTKALKLAYTNFSQYAKEVLKGEVELLIHNYIDGAYHDGSN